MFQRCQGSDDQGMSSLVPHVPLVPIHLGEQWDTGSGLGIDEHDGAVFFQ